MSYEIGHAAVLLWRSMEKQGGDAELSYGLKGKLYLSKSGWLLMHIPNALARGAFDALHEPGAELPPGHNGDFNAHVSVMRPEEIAQIPGGAEKITERGHEVGYTLGPVRVVDPDGWSEMSKCWFIEVRSPELEKIRKSYGLTPLPSGNHQFHVTIGVRRKHVLRHNDVAKAAGVYGWAQRLKGAAMTKHVPAVLSMGSDGGSSTPGGTQANFVSPPENTSKYDLEGSRGTPKDADVLGPSVGSMGAPDAIKVPEVTHHRQETDYTCGPAALKEVVEGELGRAVPEKKLENAAEAGPEKGTEPPDLAATAQRVGLQVRFHPNSSVQQLCAMLDAKHPVIVSIQAYGDQDDYQRLESGHYVVVVGYDQNNIYIQDPSIEGEGKHGFIPINEFEARWHDREYNGRTYHHLAIEAWRPGTVEPDRAPQNPEKIALDKQADLLPDVELQPQQQRIQDTAGDDVRKLLYHSLGSGKTLSAIAAAEQSQQPYTAVMPASLRTNFLGARNTFTDQAIPATVASYSDIALGKRPPVGHTLIFDEAQRLRNSGSKTTLAAKDLARQAQSVYLLSGSPIVNAPHDMAPLMSILRGEEMSPEQFDKQFLQDQRVQPGWLSRVLHGATPGTVTHMKNPEQFREMLQGHVDYHAPQKPPVEQLEERITTEMSPEQAQIYRAIWEKLPAVLRWKLSRQFPLSKQEFRNLQAFLTGPRMAGLSTYPFMKEKQDAMLAFQQSPKLQRAMEEVTKYHQLHGDQFRGVAFSNYIDAGLTPYQAALAAKGIPSAIFHGGLSDEQRKRLVQDYNTGKLRMLLLGPSGGEGISLRGTRLMQLLDPHWNEARMIQAIGRGARFDSHTHLPPEERKMRVQRYISQLPPSILDKLLYAKGRRASQVAADEYMEQLSQRKQELIEEFNRQLREAGQPKTAESTGIHDSPVDSVEETDALLKFAEYAPGIPDPANYGDPFKSLSPGELYDLVVQLHEARRAGLHYDYRIGNQQGLHSWAMRKGVPLPGEKHMGVHQPIHSYDYRNFEGEIPEGYGAGRVSSHEQGQVLINRIGEHSIEFSTAHTRFPERFALVRPQGWDPKHWLMINTTPVEALPYNKVRYKKIPADQVEGILQQLKEGDTVEAKIDGASSLVKLLKDGVEVTSYRAAKGTGRPIVHTERVFHGRPKFPIPPELVGTVLKGELYGVRNPLRDTPVLPGGGQAAPEAAGAGRTGDLQDGPPGGQVHQPGLEHDLPESVPDGGLPDLGTRRPAPPSPIGDQDGLLRMSTNPASPGHEGTSPQDARGANAGAAAGPGDGLAGGGAQVPGRVLPAHELGGILNASLAEALAKQRSGNIRLRNMLFDIQSYGGQPVGADVPRDERRRMMEQVLQHLPGDYFHLPPVARTPQEALELWNQIKNKQHPLTEEGVVIHPVTGKPMKGKLTEDADVHITGIFPGEGKYQGVGAGGFEYALAPDGPTVGRVGTGLSDEFRRELWANPDLYKGRVAKIRSLGQFAGGAHRAPAFLALHEDWTPPEPDPPGALP